MSDHQPGRSETTSLPDYWKEPEPSKGISLMGWTLIIAAIAIPLKLIWEIWQ